MLDWDPVVDPSGVVSYTVLLYERNAAGLARIGTWRNLRDTQLNVNPETNCGGKYYWRVQGWDGVGNGGIWSDKEFEIAPRIY
jgi:hypothetical protein